MSNVPMYGFGGGSGTGGVLTVLAPAGHTVTISKDGKTKTKTANDDGVAVFKGLSAGAWTYVITDGTQTSQPQTADVAYETTVMASYFSATIHISYPAGAVCTATDGTIKLTAPDTSGVWDCVVQHDGSWKIALDNGLYEMVTVSEHGQYVTVDRWHIYDNGNELTDITGGWTAKGIGVNPDIGYGNRCEPTVTKMEGCFKLSLPIGWKSGIYTINNKIDLTHINTLAATVSNVTCGTESVYFSVFSDIDGFADVLSLANLKIPVGTNKKTVELDVSGITGSQYIVFYLISDNTVVDNITVHDVCAM